MKLYGATISRVATVILPSMLKNCLLLTAGSDDVPSPLRYRNVLEVGRVPGDYPVPAEYCTTRHYPDPAGYYSKIWPDPGNLSHYFWESQLYITQCNTKWAFVLMHDTGVTRVLTDEAITQRDTSLLLQRLIPFGLTWLPGALYNTFQWLLLWYYNHVSYRSL